MTRVKKCTINDIPDLKRLSSLGLASEYSDDYWREAVDNYYNICYTYRDNRENVIGYVLAQRYPNTTIMSIVVEPIHRRHDIGTTLVDAMEKEMVETLKRTKKTERHIEIRVREKNCGAQEFWENLDYVYLGCKDDYYKDGEAKVYYEKVLRPR